MRVMVFLSCLLCLTGACRGLSPIYEENAFRNLGLLVVFSGKSMIVWGRFMTLQEASLINCVSISVFRPIAIGDSPACFYNTTFIWAYEKRQESAV